MRVQEKVKSDWPDGAGVPVLISEMDGSMLPVVETAEPGAGEAAIDGRKTRQVGWKEARLALAHTPGSVTPIFGASLGTVEEAGERLASGSELSLIILYRHVALYDPGISSAACAQFLHRRRWPSTLDYGLGTSHIPTLRFSWGVQFRGFTTVRSRCNLSICLPPCRS